MVTASAICLPMGMVGFRAVSGSWNTMEKSFPRSFRISRSEQWVMSRPSARMVPETMEARLGSSPMTLLHRMLLPQPDSPTSASTSPGATAKDTSRTAWTVPAVEGMWTERCSTSSKLFRSTAFLL